MRKRAGLEPYWYVTTLDESARLVTTERDEDIGGFRLNPATTTDNAALLQCVEGRHYSELDVTAAIEDSAVLDLDTLDALTCLSKDNASVASAARTLGVSTRTLQRKLLSSTSKSPVFWYSLARARKAAASMLSDIGFAEIALAHGYSDQSHFTREITRWFRYTPKQLRQNPQQLHSIALSGYGSPLTFSR